jgi:hypothetical protein
MEIKEGNFIKKVEGYSKESMQIIEDKTKMYGVSSIGQLGIRAEFVQIHRKYARLKNMIWENVITGKEEKYDDTLRDTLLDMANYCYIMIYILERDKK